MSDPGAIREIHVESEEAMARLGADLAAALSIGDQVGLVGDLGAGKTTLARAILRRLAQDPTLDVPSPTFTLVQRYDEGRIPVRHADLYRLADPAEAEELGLGEPDAADLVEWPKSPLPITVDIAFRGTDPNARTVRVRAPKPFIERLDRRLSLRRFMDTTPFASAAERDLSGDASTRMYLRFRASGGGKAVLMDAPAYTPAPKSYAAVARLADGNNRAFLAVGATITACGLSAPKVIAAEPDDGFLLLEDLGDEKIAVDGKPVPERYIRAAETLAALHNTQVSFPLSDTVGGTYMPPRLDADLITFAAAVYPQWIAGKDAQDEHAALWREVAHQLPREDERLALRDYHSPNCLWLPEREGIAQVGIIDFQDAMIAPSAYDVVSLAQDARVPIPEALEEDIVARYLACREGIDRAAFREAYAILGAQRAARIAGVFRRLNDQDGKPQYLRHIPRVVAALRRNLAATPTLAGLSAWYAAHPPATDAP